jgi:hypothetical protein
MEPIEKIILPELQALLIFFRMAKISFYYFNE